MYSLYLDRRGLGGYEFHAVKASLLGLFLPNVLLFSCVFISVFKEVLVLSLKCKERVRTSGVKEPLDKSVFDSIRRGNSMDTLDPAGKKVHRSEHSATDGSVYFLSFHACM